MGWSPDQPGMIPWRSYPVIRLLIPFIAGIVIADKAGLDEFSRLVPVVSWLLAIVSIRVAPGWLNEYSFRWVSGSLMALTVLFLGLSMGPDHSLYQAYCHYSSLMGEAGHVFVVRIKDEPVAKGRSIICTGSVRYIMAKGTAPARCHGKVRLVFRQPDSAFAVKYGDLLMVMNDPVPVNGPENPNAFDFRKFLMRRGIFHQFFLKEDNYQVIDTGGDPVVKLSIGARSKLRKILESHGIRDQRLGLANAMLLGSRELLDGDTLENFSRAGAMHILCVSGLHVGVIYLVLSLMIPRSIFRGKLRNLWPVIILSGIWGYAFLTGLSPSVQRASVMFTMMTAGSHMRRSGNVFNNLAGSAIILLIINPQILFYLGFQLSYLAVAGIALFEKPLASLIHPGWIVTEKIWRLGTVSMAAQAGTAPLAVHYFHAFPAYFLLTNLVVIPMSSLIIYTAVILFALNPVYILSNQVAGFLDLLLQALDRSVDAIQSMQGSVIEPVSAGGIEVMIMYTALIIVYVAVMRRRKILVYVAIGSVILLLSVFYGKELQAYQQRRIVFYKVSRSTCVDLIKGKSCLFLYDGRFSGSGAVRESFFAKGNRDALLVRVVNRYEIKRGMELHEKDTYFRYPVLIFQGRSFLFIDEESGLEAIKSEGPGFDYLVILDCRSHTLENLLSKLTFSEVILTSSVPSYLLSGLINTCKEHGLPCWSVWNEGAKEVILK